MPTKAEDPTIRSKQHPGLAQIGVTADRHDLRFTLFDRIKALLLGRFGFTRAHQELPAALRHLLALTTSGRAPGSSRSVAARFH